LRKQDAEPGDFKSVFLFNILSSVAIYLLLLVATPFLADYYAMPILGEVAPLFFLMIPLNALGVIQYTILSRRFCFARLSKIIFAAQVVSGVAAVVLATMGWGVWALVWQQVVLMGVRSALLWWWGGWSPAGRGSLGALAKMAPYSVSVMASDLVTALYNKVPQLVLGKIYLDATLGYYDQAIKLKDLPVQSAMQSVQQVTFPALARIAHEQPKFAESFRPFVKAHSVMPKRAQTVSYKLLNYFIDFIKLLAPALSLKCVGEDERADLEFAKMLHEFGKNEVYIETFYDQALYGMTYTAYKGIFPCALKNLDNAVNAGIV
jgi:tetratricopeptide (TPR) repeat protein